MGLGKLLFTACDMTTAENKKQAIMFDAAFHMVVSLVIFGTSIMPTLDLHDHATAASLGAIILAASLLQALYHFGLLLRIQCTDENEELSVGSILRNILTGVGIVSSVAIWGQLVRLGKFEGNNMVFLVAVILFAVMRLLDTFMNGEYAKYNGIEDLWKHSCKDDDAVIVENANKVALFTPRVVLVHIILVCCVVASALDLSPTAGYLEPVSGEASTNNMIAALVFQALHLILYPFALLLNACGVGSSPVSSAEKGECNRTELVSINRIPIIRSLVAWAVLSCLSYAYGNLTGAHPTQLLLLNIALYFAVDQIGFDVV